MSTVTTLTSSGETSIDLQTRKGNDVPNSQSHEFSHFERNVMSEYSRKFPRAIFRTLPNPIYNCHGLVFASTRTGIHLNDALKSILNDDGYTEVSKDKILPGDVILYYGDDGDIEHSGIVVSTPDKTTLNIPLVVSKWGKLGEAVHWANDSPYNFANRRYFRVTKWD